MQIYIIIKAISRANSPGDKLGDSKGESKGDSKFFLYIFINFLFIYFSFLFNLNNYFFYFFIKNKYLTKGEICALLLPIPLYSLRRLSPLPKLPYTLHPYPQPIPTNINIVKVICFLSFVY